MADDQTIRNLWTPLLHGNFDRSRLSFSDVSMRAMVLRNSVESMADISIEFATPAVEEKLCVLSMLFVAL
jgi:hypothetical protein